MRENRQSGSEGGGTKPIASPYPYEKKSFPRSYSLALILATRSTRYSQESFRRMR